jgi:hypothetical protein
MVSDAVKTTMTATALGTAALMMGLLQATAASASTTNATAATSTAGSAAACRIWPGSVTSGGDHALQNITSTSPPTSSPGRTTHGVYPDGQARLSTHFVREPDAGGDDVYGDVVLGDSLYSQFYRTDYNTGELDPNYPNGFHRVGGGWSSFTALESSTWDSYTEGGRTAKYGLRNDGVLFRWTVDGKGVWHGNGSYAGFGAVKSMALISKTRTYDTFLMNLRGGGLYTVHIPSTSPLKPVVKVVRASTWGGFESLVAQKCGAYGTLLLGIDKDTHLGYLYAVGHANGTSTVIQSIGKVPSTFDDPVYFRWGVVEVLDPLFGE